MSLTELGGGATASVADEPSSPSIGGDGGAEPSPETLPAEPSSEPVEPPAEPTAEPTPEPSQPEAPLTTPTGALPNEFRSLFKHADPAVAALGPKVQSMWDRLQAYTTHFPTVADAKQFSETFPGGVADALAASARAAELDETDIAFASNDPAQHRSLAENWIESDPENYSSLITQGLEVLAGKDPQAYQSIGNKVFEATLANYYRTALGQGNQEAAARLAQLHEDVFGRKLGEQPRVDPRAAELDQRRQQLDAKERDITNRASAEFATSANAQVAKQVQSTITANLATALGKLKISEQAKQRIASEIFDDINQKLIGDKGLQTRLQSILQTARKGGFSDQARQQWIDALNARAKNLLGASATAIIDRWTKDYLGVVQSSTKKIESAASRRDVGGGGLPNYSMQPLTADQISKMSTKDLLAYNGPVDPAAQKQLREMRAAGKPA
jgi:hypothetical protein